MENICKECGTDCDLVDEIFEDHKKKINKLEKENAELKAHVAVQDNQLNSLYNLAQDLGVNSEWLRLNFEVFTPAQSLAAIEAAAIEELTFPVMLRKMWSGREVNDWIKQQAQNKRNQAKDKS